MNSSTQNWAYAQALLNAQCAIPKQQKSGGAVEYWREWDADRHCAMWVKTYRNTGQFQLGSLNQAEVEILMHLAAHKVPNTYRPALIKQVRTQLGHVGHGANAQYNVKTNDAGATLADWLRAPVATHLNDGTRAQCWWPRKTSSNWRRPCSGCSTASMPTTTFTAMSIPATSACHGAWLSKAPRPCMWSCCGIS